MRVIISAVSAVSGIACVLYYILKKRQSDSQMTKDTDLNTKAAMQTIIEEQVENNVASEPVTQDMTSALVQELEKVKLEDSSDSVSKTEVDFIECDENTVSENLPEESKPPSIPNSPIQFHKRGQGFSISESSDTASTSEIVDSSQEDDSAVDVRCSSASSKANSSRKSRKRKSRKVVDFWLSDNSNESSWSPASSPSTPTTPYQHEFVIDAVDHEFSIQTKLAGKLIGRDGQCIKKIMKKTDTHIVVKGMPTGTQTCVVSGYRDDVSAAVSLIKSKFTSMNTEHIGLPFPPMKPLSLKHIFQLRQTILTRVALCDVQTPGSVTVQLLDHPSYAHYYAMKQHMDTYYDDIPPPSCHEIKESVYAIHKQENGCHRVHVLEVKDQVASCQYADWGGFCNVPIDDLRLISKDFLTVEFQGNEACVYGIIPYDKKSWSPDAKNYMLTMSGSEFYVRMIGWSGSYKPVLEFFFVGEDGQLHSLKDQLISLNLAQDIKLLDVSS